MARRIMVALSRRRTRHKLEAVMRLLSTQALMRLSSIRVLLSLIQTSRNASSASLEISEEKWGKGTGSEGANDIKMPSTITDNIVTRLSGRWHENPFDNYFFNFWCTCRPHVQRSIVYFMARVEFASSSGRVNVFYVLPRSFSKHTFCLHGDLIKARVSLLPGIQCTSFTRLYSWVKESKFLHVTLFNCSLFQPRLELSSSCKML